MQILLAEDDRYVLDYLEYEVKNICPDAFIDKFWDGMSALKATRIKKYDLVITDIIMRHVCGDELARHILKESPQTQILFETCESEKDIVKRGIPMERCIIKPFVKGDLEYKINNVQNLPLFEIEREEKRKGWFWNKRLRRM